MIKVGDALYSSCKGDYYGEVIGVGFDGNNIPTIDIGVFDAGDLIAIGNTADEGWPDYHGLMELELPEGVLPILRNVQYKLSEHRSGLEGMLNGTYTSTGIYVTCLTPGNGCFRCTKFFSVYRK